MPLVNIGPIIRKSHVEIYKRRKELEDTGTRFLVDPVVREGKEIFVPVMPRDSDEMMALVRRVREDLTKEHAKQETGVSKEKGTTEVAQEA